MLQKRRVTAHPVDAAQLCGYDNSMVVSFLNGIDHLVLDPAATDQDDAQPLPSRVVVRSYTGVQIADVAVHTHTECVAEAAVNAAGVVACRMAPLTASTAVPTAAYPVRADGGAVKIVFFGGCQRLAEVSLSDELTQTARAHASESGASPLPATSAACPMQCFRVESRAESGTVSLDIAAFMQGAHTLCACTPQLGKMQTIGFEEQHVCCMGPGRVGRAEVTVVLSNGVAVLCGVSALSSPAAGLPSPSQVNEELAASSSQERAIAAATAARQALADANARSSFCILHTVQLASPAEAAHTPVRVAWSGASTLWVVYSDGSVTAVHCNEVVAEVGAPSSAHSEQNEESQPESARPHGAAASSVTAMTVKTVLHTRLPLPASDSGSVARLQCVHTNADPRAPVLHVAYTTPANAGAATRLYYGTVRLIGGADSPSCPALQWRQQWIPYEEQLHGVRFERGRFHILAQAVRGGGPLFITTLPRDAPVASSSSSGTASGADADLAAAIMRSPESELAGHCQTCKALLRELSAATRGMTSDGDAEVLLSRLVEAQHALYALLRRQQASCSVSDLAPSESLPHRLLQRAARLHRQLCAYVLLLRLGSMESVSKPLRVALHVEEATAISKSAQAQWLTLMQETFRSVSVYQSAVSELAMWQAPAPLCIDVLLRQLGVSVTDASCTMASILSKMDTLTAEHALLILYFSYQTMGCAGNSAAAASAVPYDAQQQRCQWRESFLLSFGQPVELNVWAFTCYAVDHGFNPAEEASETDETALYVLGAAVHHLGTPPSTALLAPVVNGLAHVAALDVLLHLIPTCIATYTTSEEGVPVAVAMRLLCVAVRAGSSRMIESLYEMMRTTPALRDLAAQPLAYAALAAGDVAAMRGWVEVGSGAANTIERTLHAAESIHQREAVLIQFYILQQRYEEALQVCSSATAADATQAQRLQVVLSYLRSLLSASSPAWGEDVPMAAAADVDSLLPVTASMHQPWRLTTMAAPLLVRNPQVLAAQLKSAAASAAADHDQAGASAAAGTTASGAAAGQSLVHSGVTGCAPPQNVKPPLFRPSTLLASVERETQSRERGLSSPPPSTASTGFAGRD